MKKKPFAVSGLVSFSLLASIFASTQITLAGDQLPVSAFLGTYTVGSCTSANATELSKLLPLGTVVTVALVSNGVEMKPATSYNILPTFVNVNGPKHVRKWMGSDPIGSPCGKDIDGSKTTDKALVGESKEEETFHFAAICGIFYTTENHTKYSLTKTPDGLDFSFETLKGDAYLPNLTCSLKAN